MGLLVAAPQAEMSPIFAFSKSLVINLQLFNGYHYSQTSHGNRALGLFDALNCVKPSILS